MREASIETIGIVEQKTKPQWQLDNQDKIVEITKRKREAFQHGTRKEYKRERNKVKNELKKMINEWWHNRAREVQAAADRHDTGGLFQGIRELGAIYTRKITNPTVKGTDGSKLNTREQETQMERAPCNPTQRSLCSQTWNRGHGRAANNKC